MLTLVNVQNVSSRGSIAVAIVGFFFLSSLFGVDEHFFDSRTWTDSSGRQIDAEYVKATKYQVTIRRNSDGRVFTIPVTTLSEQDQKYINVRLQVEEAKRPAPELKGTDPFAAPQTPHLRGNVQIVERLPPSIVLGEGKTADRSKIPSLGYDELEEGYPEGPSNLVNVLVWWGDLLEPEIMPYSDREKSIKRISKDIERYVGNYTNSPRMFSIGIRTYNERRLDAYAIETTAATNYPTIDELNEKANGWEGAFVSYSFYELDSSDKLRRVGARTATLVEVEGQTIIQNLMGTQYELKMSATPIEDEKLPEFMLRSLDSSRKDGCYEVVNVPFGSEPFIPEGQIAIIEVLHSFRLLKLEAE